MLTGFPSSFLKVKIMAEKTTAKIELATLTSIVEAGDKLNMSVNGFLQNIMTHVLGSLTRLSGNEMAQDDFIKGIGAALKKNKVACKYKSQLFDFMEWEAGICKKDDGHWHTPRKADGETPDNKPLVEACKKAKTEGFTGYVSLEKQKAQKAAREEKKAKDAALSAEAYVLQLLEDAKADAMKKYEAAKLKQDADRWASRASLLDSIVKARKSAK